MEHAFRSEYSCIQAAQEVGALVTDSEMDLLSKTNFTSSKIIDCLNLRVDSVVGGSIILYLQMLYLMKINKGKFVNPSTEMFYKCCVDNN